MLKSISILCVVTVLVYSTKSFTQSNNNNVLLYSQTLYIFLHTGGSIVSSYDLFEQTMRCPGYR